MKNGLSVYQMKMGQAMAFSYDLKQFQSLKNKSDSINNLVTTRQMNVRFFPNAGINLKD